MTGLLEPLWRLPPGVTPRAGFGVLLEVLVRGEVVAAGGFVVASAYGFVEDVAIVIDVGR